MKDVKRHYRNNSYCVGYQCPYADGCMVGIAQNETCELNFEVEETANKMMKAINDLMLNTYDIGLEGQDHQEFYNTLKDYVLHDILVECGAIVYKPMNYNCFAIASNGDKPNPIF